MAGVGCEIIATHNALRLSGNSSELCSVIRSFETNGYLMANGYLGSDPYAIGEYLSAKSVTYTEYPDNDSYSAFAKAVADSLSAKERKTFIILSGTPNTSGTDCIPLHSGPAMAQSWHITDTPMYLPQKLILPLTISSLAKLVATDTSPATNCDNQK